MSLISSTQRLFGPHPFSLINCLFNHFNTKFSHDLLRFIEQINLRWRINNDKASNHLIQPWLIMLTTFSHLIKLLLFPGQDLFAVELIVIVFHMAIAANQIIIKCILLIILGLLLFNSFFSILDSIYQGAYTLCRPL